MIRRQGLGGGRRGRSRRIGRGSVAVVAPPAGDLRGRARGSRSPDPRARAAPGGCGAGGLRGHRAVCPTPSRSRHGADAYVAESTPVAVCGTLAGTVGCIVSICGLPDFAAIRVSGFLRKAPRNVTSCRPSPCSPVRTSCARKPPDRPPEPASPSPPARSLASSAWGLSG